MELETKDEFVDKVTKKTFQKMVMPPENSRMVDGSRIVYINYGKLRFTAISDDLPEIGTILEWNDKVYKVCYLNPEKKRFSAEFIGFKKPAERPKESIEDTAKLLDEEEIEEEDAEKINDDS